MVVKSVVVLVGRSIPIERVFVVVTGHRTVVIFDLGYPTHEGLLWNKLMGTSTSRVGPCMGKAIVAPLASLVDLVGVHHGVQRGEPIVVPVVRSPFVEAKSTYFVVFVAQVVRGRL